MKNFDKVRGTQILQDICDDQDNGEEFEKYIPSHEKQFLFHGGGQNVTTTKELRDWLKVIIPDFEQCNIVPNCDEEVFNAAKVFDKGMKVTNPELVEFTRQQRENDEKRDKQIADLLRVLQTQQQMELDQQKAYEANMAKKEKALLD